ncbi:hypothetical protein OAG05_02790 [Akkermansiaceae bacterium]|nr:hypothetical protein [Akkermansiaceae bacterium]
MSRKTMAQHMGRDPLRNRRFLRSSLNRLPVNLPMKMMSPPNLRFWIDRLLHPQQDQFIQPHSRPIL